MCEDFNKGIWYWHKNQRWQRLYKNVTIIQYYLQEV